MKKNRRIFSGLTTLIITVAICLSAIFTACSVVTKNLEELTLNTENVKTQFNAGDEFTSNGLKASVKYAYSDGNVENIDVTDDVVVDSSAYRSVVGTYEIKVSYKDSAGAEVLSGYSVTVVRKLSSLALNTSNVNTLFMVGEQFSSTGLVASANYLINESQFETVDVSNNVTIDSSAYKSDKIGYYQIIVTYTDQSETVESSYSVQVIEPRKGLDVTFKESCGEPVYLSATQKTADISDFANWIEVRQSNEKGEIDANAPALDSSKYSLKVFKNKDEVTDLTSVNRGAYQIWASMEDEESDYVYEGFALYYVVDRVESLELIENESTLTQPKSRKDNMSYTWQFKVTYESGDTSNVDKTNRYLNIPVFNTNSVANSGSVTVSYNEPLPDGKPQMKTTVVSYTLTGEQAIPDLAILNFSDIATLPATGLVVDGGSNTSFEIITGLKGELRAMASSINLPMGISVGGNEVLGLSKCYLTGGSSSATNGRYVDFSANGDFEIYVYARSNGGADRYVQFEVNDDYSNVERVDNPDVKQFSDLLADKDSAPYAHAQHITEVPKEGAKYRISFSGNIQLFYVLIIYDGN